MSSYFKINVIKSNKINNAITFVKINTSQKDLLLSLLTKFKFEKNVIVNSKDNFITKIYPGVGGVIFTGPESKIVNTVRLILVYLLKNKVKDNQYFGQVEGNYKKLHDDILKGVEVVIISKAKTVRTEKFKLVENIIKSTIVKDDIPNNKPRNVSEFKVVENVSGVIPELVVLLENHSFKFSKSNLILFEETNLKMYKQSFKDIIKNTGVMFGKINPSGNKEKNKIIENSISALKSVLSDLHGVDIKKFDFVLSSENLKILNKLDI
jgi:hypothetical protein